MSEAMHQRAEHVGDGTMPIRLRAVGRDDWWARKRGIYERFGKRPFDVVASVAIAVMLSPVIVLVALGVRLTMGKGVLYRQERLGLGAEPFVILKFRSMGHDRRLLSVATGWTGPERRLTHKTEADPRHTPFGRFIRKFSLDELPQLWNVIRGDMSLVGPRPELPHVAAQTGIVDHPRHSVRPGITGPWQLAGSRAARIADNVHLDEAYLERISFVRDVTLLVKTPIMLLGHRGS